MKLERMQKRKENKTQLKLVKANKKSDLALRRKYQEQNVEDSIYKLIHVKKETVFHKAGKNTALFFKKLNPTPGLVKSLRKLADSLESIDKGKTECNKLLK